MMIEALYWKFAGEYGHGGVSEVGGVITDWPSNWPPQPSPAEIEDIIEEYQAYLFGLNLSDEVSQYRQDKELDIKEEGVLSSYCNNESVSGLTECIEHLKDDLSMDEVSWKGPNGPEFGGIEDLSNLRFKVVSWRQKGRKAEKHILDIHSVTPYTDDSWKVDFDNYMEE